MAADEVIHFRGVVVVSVQKPLAEHIHRVLFVFRVVEQSLLQGDVTKGLRKSQQKRIFAGFTTGQNIFHSSFLFLSLIPVLRQQHRR